MQVTFSGVDFLRTVYKLKKVTMTKFVSLCSRPNMKCGIKNFHASRRHAVDVKEILYVPKSVMP